MNNFLLYFLITFPLFANSQLQVDAGKDRIICKSNFGELTYPLLPYFWSDTLGGKPTAYGGVPPYSYKWEVKYYSQTASFYLNDTTIANPIFKRDSLRLAPFDYFEGYFYLTVLDSIGSKAKDSFKISSGGNFKAYDGNDAVKRKNDTIQKCTSIGGSIDTPLTYLWRPSTYVSDSTIRCPKFWNPHDIHYSCKVTDKFGCTSGFLKNLLIEIDDNAAIIDFVNSLITNFQNPINEKSIFYFNKPNDIEKINIYNNLGQKIYTQGRSDIIEVGRHTTEKGIYFIVFYDVDNRINTIKIHKE